MMKRKLYITLLGLLSTIMMAAVPYCDVRKFSITDGLAANTISDLKQGKDNLMWFSTWNGLSFYDKTPGRKYIRGILQKSGNSTLLAWQDERLPVASALFYMVDARQH